MRLSIQEDFTLGGIVSYFDPAKKGYITATDLKQADKQQSLDYLDDEDLHHILTPRKELTSNDPSVAGSAINDKRLEYQGFVRMFMPVTDKRFTTLIIQRSEKASKDPP